MAFVQSISARSIACLFALFFSLAVSPYAYAQGQTAGQDGRANRPAPETPESCVREGRVECQKLSRNVTDLLMQRELYTNGIVTRNVCRFMDNPGGNDYFVPLKDSDFSAFEVAAPGLGLRVDQCCPLQSVTLMASDGQTFAVDLPLERDVSVGADRTANVSHTFSLSRNDYTTHGDGSQTFNTVTWQETVSATYACDSAHWGLTGSSTTEIRHTGSCVAGAWVGSGPGAVQPAVPAVCAPTYIPANCPPSRVHGETWVEQTGTPSPSCSNHTCNYASGASLSGNYLCQGRRTMTPYMCNDGTNQVTGPSYDENNGGQYESCPADPGCPAGQETWNGTCVAVCTGGQTRNMGNGVCEGGNDPCPAGQARRFGEGCIPYDSYYYIGTGMANGWAPIYYHCNSGTASIPHATGDQNCAAQGGGIYVKSGGRCGADCTSCNWGFYNFNGDPNDWNSIRNPGNYSAQYHSRRCEGCGEWAEIMCATGTNFLVQRFHDLGLVPAEQPSPAGMPACANGGITWSTAREPNVTRWGGTRVINPRIGSLGGVPCTSPGLCHIRSPVQECVTLGEPYECNCDPYYGYCDTCQDCLEYAPHTQDSLTVYGCEPN